MEARETDSTGRNMYEHSSLLPCPLQALVAQALSPVKMRPTKSSNTPTLLRYSFVLFAVENLGPWRPLANL